MLPDLALIFFFLNDFEVAVSRETPTLWGEGGGVVQGVQSKGGPWSQGALKVQVRAPLGAPTSGGRLWGQKTLQAQRTEPLTCFKDPKGFGEGVFGGFPEAPERGVCERQRGAGSRGHSHGE